MYLMRVTVGVTLRVLELEALLPSASPGIVTMTAERRPVYG